MLGVGLAMDAFSVSVVRGLGNPKITRRESVAVAGVFGAFQALMPLLGWVLVHTVLVYFAALERYVPVIACAILTFIGVKMIVDAKKNCAQCDGDCRSGFSALLIQGVATSIDALSVGFTIASYDFIHALVSALIIMAVTFAICYAGVTIGKKFGAKLCEKAGIVGGAILIAIGLEILITSLI